MKKLVLGVALAMGIFSHDASGWPGWSQWRVSAFLKVNGENPEVKALGSDPDRLKAYALQHNMWNNDLKPDDWPIDYGELTSELQVISKKDFDNMLKREGSPWNRVFYLNPHGMLGIYVGVLGEVLSENLAPMTESEYIFAYNLVRKLEERHERHKKLIEAHNSEVVPLSYEYAIGGNHFPEATFLTNEKSVQERSRDWEDFKNKTRWSIGNYVNVFAELPATSKAFMKRPILEKRWADEKHQAAMAEMTKKLDALNTSHKKEIEMLMARNTDLDNRLKQLQMELNEEKQQSQEQQRKLQTESDTKLKQLQVTLDQEIQKLQKELADAEAEHAKVSKGYEEKLAQLSSNFERQTMELSSARVEWERQKSEYEARIAQLSSDLENRPREMLDAFAEGFMKKLDEI